MTQCLLKIPDTRGVNLLLLLRCGAVEARCSEECLFIAFQIPCNDWLRRVGGDYADKKLGNADVYLLPLAWFYSNRWISMEKQKKMFCNQVVAAKQLEALKKGFYNLFI